MHLYNTNQQHETMENTVKRRSARRCIIAIAAMTAATVAGCTDSGSENESLTTSATSESSASSTSGTAPTQAGVTDVRGQAGITTGTADPFPTSQLQPGTAPPVQPGISPASAATTGDLCGTVVPHATGAVQPVIVLTGSVECATALAISERYLNDTSVVIEGQGRFATVEGWRCNWPYVDGRSHAETYLQCTDSAQNSFKIGD